MRKAIVAGAVAVVLVATAFVVAPTVWSESQSPKSDDARNRRVVMLDGRGGSIGVSIRDLDADDTAKAQLGQAGGVWVEDVDEDSPAAKAGLREGDVIVDFDGERVRSARHFARLVQETADGRTVKATIVRDGARQSVDVTPARRTGRFTGDFVLPDPTGEIYRELERGLRALPRDFALDFHWDGELPGVVAWPRGRLGAQLSPLTDQLAEYFGAKAGVLVSSVEPESVAAKAGLKAGDVITSVNGRAVDTPRDVMQELRGVEEGQDVEIAILRDKKGVTLKAPLPERRRSVPRRPVRPA
ncbi:MAG: PDZ domain-containing protein [Vicinamibacterales bacterium]